MKTIYIYHEYGAPSHYHALKYLAESNGYSVKSFTFNRTLPSNPFDFFKYFVESPTQTLRNLFFLLSLPLRKKSKIVIGIAPFNNRLPLLMRFMKKHEVYYHTSYSCWDGTRYAHRPKSDKMIETWRSFTSKYVKHIFAVSEWTKEQLIKNNYALKENISVVNHSFIRKVEVEFYQPKNLSFLCVALLAEHKGITELLDFFSNHPEVRITFVGKGILEDKVRKYAEKYNNIDYAGYINGSENIIPFYKTHSFLLLNSHRTSKWEELFGMAIIEGMSAGCVPIASDHPGPLEIIEHRKDGLICREGEMAEAIKYAIKMKDEEYIEMRCSAIKKGQTYYYKNIAQRWQPVLQ